MAETEEGSGVGDWRCLISSPRNSLFSSFLSDGFPSCKPFSQLLNGPDLSAAASINPEKISDVGGFVDAADAAAARSEEDFCDWNPSGPTARNGGSGVSIAERRAARCGFNAPRINTARYRSVSPLSSPAVRSPYLTIPPGLSPTALLDSPVMLPNSQALPSPTTGTYPLPSFGQDSLIPISVSTGIENEKSEDSDSSFMFKPHMKPITMPCLSNVENQAQHLAVADIKHQNLVQVQPQLDFECEAGFLKQATITNYTTDSPSDMEGSSNMIVKVNNMPLQTRTPSAASDHALQPEELPLGEDACSQQLLEEDQKGSFPAMGMGRPSEDGYNWRKYGQKQVKGSEYPRSYYKCTHPNCQVKKKVERSHDGQITEIIYKGAHNHPKPQPSRRSAIGSAFQLSETSEMLEGHGSYVKVEGGSVWRCIQPGSKDKISPEGRADGLERTSSTSVVTELSDPLSTAQGKHLSMLESADTPPELSSTLASHDDDEDMVTQGSISLGDDAEDKESESKRRKKENCLIEASLASRAVREPRVVVQTDSEVDILDDGYRWRKYGQKVVKGNPNPRSYYKCTHAGCTVRKHVERASHDLKSVITTYEGKHNHEVPAARNSSHINSGGGNVQPASAQTTVALSGTANIPKPEPQVQDIAPRFERKPELSSEYLKPGYIGRFTADIKLGPSACYEMKLPSLQPIPFSSFGHNDIHQASSVPQVVPDFPLAFPMNLHRPANLALAGFEFNHGKSMGAALPFFGQQPKDGDMGFVRPKQEQKDEASYEARFPINHLANSSPPIYSQIMGGFPM
ncbi:probable WRKY transcription factor 20 isoform X2 [Magnolia sinica]|uniref:probable WRKY transcription factor 20 isoform X2 n=1 Tax=Magnolia sinica TaxID=86752 RepID=UPI00265990C5|nr:probable WRKY transcription factor 20 isoform X2 [Magnolia sinica]